MNLEKIELLKAAWNQVRPAAERAVELFYIRLFELDPSLRPLFKDDLARQGHKFIAALGLLVDGLDRPETIIPAIQELGRRHAGYGICDDYYHTVGQALQWMLANVLGESFTPEVEAAWNEAYYLIAGLMKEAAASARRRAPYATAEWLPASNC